MLNSDKGPIQSQAVPVTGLYAFFEDKQTGQQWLDPIPLFIHQTQTCKGGGFEWDVFPLIFDEKGTWDTLDGHTQFKRIVSESEAQAIRNSPQWADPQSNDQSKEPQ